MRVLRHSAIGVVVLATLLLSGTAGAGTSVMRVPVHFSAGSGCIGEVATFDGVTTTITSDTGEVTTLIATGYGERTGTKFIATGGTHGSFPSPSSGTVTHTENVRLRFISASGAPDYFHTTTIHYTFIPDGKLTAFVEDFRDC